MGHFYIDDSIHDEAGFIIGACIYTDNNLDEQIINIIKKHGFDPLIFEYKSSANYTKEPQKAKVREDLKELLHQCQLGIIIVPRYYRDRFGFECIKGLKQFIDVNGNLSMPLVIHFDQGMFNSIDKAQFEVNKLGFENCKFKWEQDSKINRGIQIADLAAHIASIKLKFNMGLVNKMVIIPAYDGYDAHETELGFEMWATLRYCFFRQTDKIYIPDENRIKAATLNVEPYGLYISELCNNELKEVSRAAFSKVYLGCIH